MSEANVLRSKRRSTRLKNYDYTYPAAYFVTICTQHRKFLFGDITSDRMELSPYGDIVYRCWSDISRHFRNVESDTFVVMPNHVHGIVMILGDFDEHAVGARLPRPYNRKPTLGQVVAYFKYQSTKRINEMRDLPAIKVWQRNYFDHIVRDPNSLKRICNYVLTNPLRWQLDKENPERTKVDEFDRWLDSFRDPPRQTTL